MLDNLSPGMLNAWIFWLLILIARYILLRLISKEAYRRAAHVPELHSKEVTAYKVQSGSLFASMVLSIFIPLDMGQPLFLPGLVVVGVGYLGYIVSMIDFSHVDSSGVAVSGLYKITRHPMYMTFFVIHVGIILTTLSVLYTSLIAVYQISTHWILIAEECSCLEANRKAYQEYMDRVKRYCGTTRRKSV
jgi:protein-S-isoprenylcysteine O-methyltransferase Ste14